MPISGPIFSSNTVGTADEQTIATYQDYQDYNDQPQPGYEYSDQGYYDADGNWVWYAQEEEDFLSDEVEEYYTFLQEWNPLPLPMTADEDAMSLSVWPEIDFTVRLRRLDIFQSLVPKAQQATMDRDESITMRNMEGWAPIRSIFFLNEPIKLTKDILIETGSGPIRRQRFRPHDRSNRRDTSTWYNDIPLIPSTNFTFSCYLHTPHVNILYLYLFFDH